MLSQNNYRMFLIYKTVGGTVNTTSFFFKFVNFSLFIIFLWGWPLHYSPFFLSLGKCWCLFSSSSTSFSPHFWGKHTFFFFCFLSPLIFSFLLLSSPQGGFLSLLKNKVVFFVVHTYSTGPTHGITGTSLNDCRTSGRTAGCDRIKVPFTHSGTTWEESNHMGELEEERMEGQLWSHIGTEGGCCCCVVIIIGHGTVGGCDIITAGRWTVGGGVVLARSGLGGTGGHSRIAKWRCSAAKGRHRCINLHFGPYMHVPCACTLQTKSTLTVRPRTPRACRFSSFTSPEETANFSTGKNNSPT